MREARTSRVSRAALVAVLWCSGVPLYAALPWLHVEGNKIKDPRGHEVVLRGISLIDLGYTQSREGGAIRMIDRITEPNDRQGSSPGWYPRIVRIPICPPDAGSGAPLRWLPNDDSFYTDLLRPVVDYCAKKNLYVILVSHYYPAHWLGNYSGREWITNQLQTCAAAHPVLMTEWGFTTTTETLLNGTISNYGRPLTDLMERLGIGNTAWAASYDWGPPMFRRDWTLRCGEGEMGGFVKDTLYQKKDDRQPQGSAGTSLYRGAAEPSRR
jgi:hypothetical protein